MLLGYYSYESTYAEREFLKSVKKSEYETIKNQWQVSICPYHAFLVDILLFMLSYHLLQNNFLYYKFGAIDYMDVTVL